MGNSKIVYNGETLIDISGDSVTPATLAKGATAHNANGDQIIGTMSTEGGGGESVNDVLWVTATLDLTTFSISNVSHSYDEILQALAENKIVKLKALVYGYDVEYAICEVSFRSGFAGYVMFSIFVRNFIEGLGEVLMFANVLIEADNSAHCSPYAIELIGLGG